MQYRRGGKTVIRIYAEIEKAPVRVRGLFQLRHTRQPAGHDEFNDARAALASARALDGDKLVAAGVVARAGRGNGAGDIVALDPSVRQGLCEFVRTAVGIRGADAADRAGREAAIHAVAVAVGNYEKALLSLRGCSSKDRGGQSRGCDQEPNETTPARRTKSAAKIGFPQKLECAGGVKLALTSPIRRASGSRRR